MKPVLNRLHVPRLAFTIQPPRNVGGMARLFGCALTESCVAWRDVLFSIRLRGIQRFATGNVLPISAVIASLPVLGLVFFDTPDNSNALGLFFVALTLFIWLVASSVIFLISRPRENAWSSGRCLIMGLPVALFALFGAMLQGARMMAPTTLVIGIVMVALGEYIVWPREPRGRSRAD